jgi:hypothetical protein
MEPKKTLLKKPVPILLFLIIFIASVSSPLFFVHAQIIDGTATVTGSNVTSASMTLSTTQTPDVLLLAVSYSKPFDAVSSISTSCSTSLSTAFTHEVTTSQGAVTVEVWYYECSSVIMLYHCHNDRCRVLSGICVRSGWPWEHHVTL